MGGRQELEQLPVRCTRHPHPSSLARFSGHRYDLLDWNCNNFSDELTKYLLDSSTCLMPPEILDLPRLVKTT